MSAKKSRSNKTQIKMLVDFMSTHDHLATGEFTGPLGAKRADSQWQTLKNILKEYGPDRSIEQWKQTWKDLKKGARIENAAAARARNTTGNVVAVPTVSEVGTKVLNIIGHESSTGIGPGESIIGQECMEVSVVEHEPSQPYIFPLPTFADELENIPPAFSISHPAPSSSNPAPSTSPPAPSSSDSAPSTSHPVPSTNHPVPSTSYSVPYTRHPVPSTSRPAPSTSRPVPSTSRPTPSTSRPVPSSSRPALSTINPTQNIKKEFLKLQQENNAYLQSIEQRLKERNDLLREQNLLLREQNVHLAHQNKLKRLKRFSRRF